MTGQTPQQVVTPVGRLVAGHPMDHQTVTDDNNQPKPGPDGTPRTEVYLAVAIPKGSEQHWNATDWGRAIWQAGAEGWPGGEFNSPQFAWKITDGDSTVPNRRGKKPCERDGWPGHWVMHLSTGLNVKCFHAGQYEPINQIQEKHAIKRGDYCRVCINAKGNAPSQTPGVYLNPTLFELTRAGVEIQGSGPDPSEAFGTAPAQLPPGAQVQDAAAPATGTPAPATAAGAPSNDAFAAGAGAPAPAPAPEAAAPPPAPAPAPSGPRMTAKAAGVPYESFIAKGWTDEMLIAQGYMEQ